MPNTIRAHLKYNSRVRLKSNIDRYDSIMYNLPINFIGVILWIKRKKNLAFSKNL